MICKRNWKNYSKTWLTNALEIPSSLTLGGERVAQCDIANSFARNFSDKINKLDLTVTFGDSG